MIDVPSGDHSGSTPSGAVPGTPARPVPSACTVHTWVSLVSPSPSALMRVKAMELPSGDQEDASTQGQSSVAGTTTELWPVVRSWMQRPSSQA